MEKKKVINDIENEDSIIDSTVKALNELQTSIKTVDKLSNMEEKSYILSEEDFKQYFEWENFCQGHVWDCWLVAAIDSLVSYWDYEKLIRTSVKKTDNWFYFYLPLWTKVEDVSEEVFVSFDEIKEGQRDIEWYQQFLVTWKLWIQALAIAFWKLQSNTKYKFDYSMFDGWLSSFFFLSIAPLDLDKYVLVRAIIAEKDDPYWNADKVFVEKLYTVLENFNAETDMLTLPVYQRVEKNMNRDQILSTFGHYSNCNHAVSVEKVTKKDWTLVITFSNPWDSNKSYDITFENLIKSCVWFDLCTKNKDYTNIMSGLNKTHGLTFIDEYLNNIDEDLKFGCFIVGETDLPKSFTSYKPKADNRPRSVNQVIKSTWVEDKSLQNIRKDVIVSDENDKLKISSYGLSIYLEEKWWNFVISLWENKLFIDKNRLSDSYEYEWKTTQKEKYPLYLYWAKIANFINMMRKFYINTKSRDKKNNAPFAVKDWKLEFDDNPIKFSKKEMRKRIWASVIWDDTIVVLDDRSKLWISPSDGETKQKIVNFLNKLVQSMK